MGHKGGNNDEEREKEKGKVDEMEKLLIQIKQVHI